MRHRFGNGSPVSRSTAVFGVLWVVLVFAVSYFGLIEGRAVRWWIADGKKVA